MRFISGCCLRLLSELRDHPGGLSPLFLIKMRFGKSDFDCNLVKAVYSPLEVQFMYFLFWLFNIALVLDCVFIFYLYSNL